MREVVLIVAIPIIVLILILWICKTLNFSLIPPDLRPPPLTKKGKKRIRDLYKWN